jgi:hypothetical protein
MEEMVVKCSAWSLHQYVNQCRVLLAVNSFFLTSIYEQKYKSWDQKPMHEKNLTTDRKS